jgi:2-hydroxy-6-oxonona-2,4-dienedioate hydrolase
MVWRTWGDGRPVVLLHGGSGSWNHWVRNITALTAAGRCVWVPDLPGFGESALAPDGRDADALPEPIEIALQLLSDGVACDLVGFSFGAMVGGFIAARYPNRVRRLVLVGAPALGVVPASPVVLHPWRDLSEGAERDAVIRTNLATLMLAKPESISELALALHVSNLLCDRMPRRRLSQTDVLRRTLREVHSPVFGIWGAEDVLYRSRLALLAEALEEAANDFRSLSFIPEAGHWVQFERAEAFNSILVEMLEEGRPRE